MKLSAVVPPEKNCILNERFDFVCLFEFFIENRTLVRYLKISRRTLQRKCHLPLNMNGEGPEAEVGGLLDSVERLRLEDFFTSGARDLKYVKTANLRRK